MMRGTALFLLPLFTGHALGASVLFSNFGPNDSFDINTGLTVTQDSGNLKTSLSFTSSGEFQLTQIDFVTTLLDVEDQNQVTLTLTSSDADGNPGTTIEAFSFSGQMGVLSATDANAPIILNAVSSINPTLHAGTTYWITAECTTTSHVVWNLNTLDPNDTGQVNTFQGGIWASKSVSRGVFRILGNPVSTPED